VQEHGGEPIIPFSGVFEQKLADMPDDEAAVYCKENQLQRCLPFTITSFFNSI
jgi:obg-like ATPase 1